MLAGTAWGVRNRSQPDAVSITQSSEFGTVYSLAEIAEISAIARDKNLSVHMDGARFANALARLGCSPAEMTWRAGVDILSFGATKNGAMSADAIVVFDRDLVEPLSYRLRRAGQTWSKMRYASAQLLAYVEGDLYLRLATKANEVAARLGAGLAALPGVRLVAPVEANLVFINLPVPTINRLAAAGLPFARRGQDVIRFVTHFDSTEQEADEVIALVRGATTGG